MINGTLLMQACATTRRRECFVRHSLADNLEFSAVTNPHGVGQKMGRRVLSMGVVKEDDGDLDKALSFHRSMCSIQEEVDAILLATDRRIMRLVEGLGTMIPGRAPSTICHRR